MQADRSFGRTLRRLLRKLISWCPVYKAALGGHWYYSYVRGRRYEPSQFCRCGENVEIGDRTLIVCPRRMKIGHDVFIGQDCRINAVGGVQVGNFCALASQVTVLTLDHHYRGAESLPWGEARLVKPIVIEDYVWVGMNAFLLPGVTIGEGAIVGLGAVVAKDVPPRAVVVGNPARVVKYRDEAEYNLLKNSGAIRSPNARCKRLRVPEEMRRKYGELLTEIGYDVKSGEETFAFDAWEQA